MGLLYGSGSMHPDANELLEQGIVDEVFWRNAYLYRSKAKQGNYAHLTSTGSGHLQYSCGVTNLLCDVHIFDDSGKCDHV